MHINRNGFVFNTAYAFVEPHERPTGSVSGCMLLWRFLWCGFWKVFVNVVIFGICGVILFGLVATPAWFVVNFLVGRKLSYRPSSMTAPFLWQWLDRLGDRSFVGHYKSDINWDLPKLFGFRIVPLPVILAAGFIAWNVFVIMSGRQAAAAGLLTADDWRVTLLAIEALFISIVGTFFLIVLLISLVRKNEFWRLAQANLRSFKEHTCPVVEIVG